MSRTVKLRFQGLMFFHFEDFTECRVGIHTKAKHHKVIIKVGKEENGVVDGEALVIPTNVIRTIEHLWLYVTDVNNVSKLPEPPRISVDPEKDPSFEKVMDMRECFKKREGDNEPLKPKWGDVLKPSLHIAAGRFFAKTVTDNCRLVNEDAIANLYFAIFQPTDRGLDGRFDQTKVEYKKNDPKTLAEIIGVDITVEDNQRLVLAIGNDTGPDHVLFSTLPDNELAILIANLPPRSAILPKDLGSVSHDDKEDEGEEKSQYSSRQRDIEKQIKDRLRHSFHFLHYYDAFDNTPDHRLVLLAKTDDLDDKQIRDGVRPDPPCKGVRGALPFKKEESATSDPEANRSA